MTTHEKKWYAIYTNPRAEKKVTEQLSTLGISVYLPLQTVVKQWSDRKKKIEEPLFKSYVFVCIEMERERSTVLGVDGVVKFVRIGGEVPIIRDEIICTIKLSLKGYSDIIVKQGTFTPNQQVEIIAGALKGHTATIIEQQSGQYCAIQIEELGAHILLKIPSNQLLIL